MTKFDGVTIHINQKMLSEILKAGEWVNNPSGFIDFIDALKTIKNVADLVKETEKAKWSSAIEDIKADRNDSRTLQDIKLQRFKYPTKP